MVSDSEHKPKMVCAFGEKSFGGKYRQGNRVYSSNNIAVALMSGPTGGMGGYSSLYLVEIDAE